MSKFGILYKIFALLGLLLCWLFVFLDGGLTDMTIVHMSVISSVWITCCYFPQIVKLLKTKNADGISVDFWLNLDIALLALTISTASIGVLHGTWGAFITEALNLIFALTVTILVFRYQHKKDPS